eukprot:TRINITY_DN7124_c0_g1_i5.p1 TRINITY_DN7124_c0_g1~~TRINITY_DN7124_c0_g1_i5.p1  ORF type:complete len:568 (+),score=165.98 TRINITY_DN7124_c0_g1_i5:84-1706(+)
MSLLIPKNVRAAWAARTCRPSARCTPSDDNLGDSLMDGAAAPPAPPPTAARSRIAALRSRVSRKLDRVQLPAWAKGKKRSACGATQTDLEPRPVLHFQEFTTSMRVAEPLLLIMEQSSSFQPEEKQFIVAQLQREVAALQGERRRWVGNAAVAQENVLRAALRVWDDEDGARAAVEQLASNEFQALQQAFRAPGEDSTNKKEATEKKSAEAQLRPPKEGEELDVANAKVKLVKKLGDGACGNVYVAVTVGSAKCSKVAVKIEARPDRARALRQLEWARGFTHKNVIRTVYSCKWEPAHVLSLMQLGDSTLTAYLKQDLCVLKKCHIVAGVAQGLAYLHQNGYVHNDVDDSNVVMIGATPLITDFGTLAKAGEPGGFNGRPQMSSPEKCALYGKDEPAPAVPTWDAYSFGLLGHQILAGSPPGTRAALMNQVWNYTCTKHGTTEDAAASDPALAGKLAVPFKQTYCHFLATAGPEMHAQMHTVHASIPPPVGAVLAQLWAWDAAERMTARQAADRLKDYADSLKAAADTSAAVEPAGGKTA